MGRVYSKLVESFGYLTEAPVNDTGYDPDKVQYAWQGGKANPEWPGNKPPAGPDTSDYTDPRGTDNVTNDPNKPKPKPGMSSNAGTRAYQHWLNSHGASLTVDGKYGPQTISAASGVWDRIAKINPNTRSSDSWWKDEKKYKIDMAAFEKLRDEYQQMQGVGTAHNVKVAPGSGYMYVGSPEYLNAMKKYGYDPKTGNPISGFRNPNAELWAAFDKQKTAGVSGQPETTPGKPGATANSPQFKTMTDSVTRLEALLKKYNIQAECSYNKDGSLLTEDDWVLKHIDLFTEQEQMEIWKLLSEAELSSFGTVGDNIAARRRAGELDQRIATAQANMANRAAQNASQEPSKLAKFGRNLGTRFGLGGGKRAALKGAAKFGLRAIPFLGTAVLLWDVGSALYDTFATSDIADMSPEDQQAIAKEIKTITEFSKSADYNNAPDDLKKRITAVLTAANKLAQQAEA